MTLKTRQPDETTTFKEDDRHMNVYIGSSAEGRRFDQQMRRISQKLGCNSKSAIVRDAVQVYYDLIFNGRRKAEQRIASKG